MHDRGTSNRIERSMVVGRLGSALCGLAYGVLCWRRWKKLRREVEGRRGAEKALRERGELFRKLVQNASDVVTLLEADGTVRYQSPAIERVMGYGDGEMVGENVFDYVHPEDREGVFEVFAGLVGGVGINPTVEFRFRHRDGSWRHIESIASNHFDVPGLNSVVVNSRDVTERKRAEEALHASERRFRSVIEQSPSGIHVFEPDGRSLRANDAWNELWGLREGEEPEGTNVFEDEQLRETGLLPYVEESVACSRPVSSSPLLHDPARVEREGEPRWLQSSVYPVKDEAGRVMEMVLTVEDVTERREAEEALRESEERFRSLVRNASDMIMVLDADGTIRYRSPAGERILGFRNDERIGTRNFDNIHPQDVGRARETFDAALDNPGVVQPPVPFRVRHKDGSWRHMEMVRNNLLDDPSVGGIVTNSRDVTEREEMEEELRRSEERYRAVVEQSVEGIFLLDGETVRVLETNRAFQEMLGYTADELRGMEVYGLVALRPEEVDSALRRTLAEKSRSVGERKYRRKDGALLDVEVGVSVIHYNGKEVVCALVRDVTERKESEARLREAEARYRTLVEQIPAATYVQEVENGNVTAAYVSPQTEAVTGYRPEEYYSDPDLWYRVVHPGDLERVKAEDERRKETGEPFAVEHRIVRRDGRVAWVLDKAVLIEDPEGGRPPYWHGVLSDITERKESEEALKGSEERFRALVRNVSDVITVLDPDGTILYESPAVERVLGYAPGERVGDSAFGYVHPDDAGFVLNGFEEGLRNPGVPVSLEFRFLHADGSWRYLDGTGTNLLHDPAVGALVVNSRDVTERKESEEALRKSEEWFRTVVQSLGEGLLITDLRDTILYVNPRMAELAGYGREEMLGRPAYELLLPRGQWEDARRRNEERAAGTTDAYELPLLRKDGATIWTEVNAVPYRDADGEIVGTIGAITDVTRRKEAEERRGEAEAKYRTLVEQLPAATYVVDVDTRELTYASPQMETMLGYPHENSGFAFQDWARRIHPEDRERVLAEFSRALESGEPFKAEYREIARDGRVVWVRDDTALVRDEEGRLRFMQGVKFDVTERKEFETRLRDSEERFRTAFEDAPIGVTLVGLDNRYLKANRAFREMLGYGEEELLGKTSFDVTHPDDLGKSMERTRRVLEGEVESQMLEKRYIRADGRVLWALSNVSAIKDSRGNPSHFVAQYQDVTERKELEERLIYQAFHDPLTGLANRALLVDRLQQALARLGRRTEPIAVLFVDLDGFKTVNDLLGHKAGDLLLVEVAERLKECVRPEDTVARFGGDEFVVLLEGISTVDGAERVAERIIETLAAPFYLPPGRREVFLSASVGIAPAVEAPGDPEKLLRDADLALYGAKRKGKGRYEVFDASTGAGVLQHLELKSSLRGALERGEFRIYYQPKVSLEEGRIEALEALVRWEHPERGLLEPEEFLPVAEETGLIVRIGERVLDEACRQGREWEERFADRWPPRVHVNLSARQFSQTDLVGRIEEALQRSGLHAQGLSLEIPEGVLMEDAEANAGKLTRLKELGIRVVIGDFGTAYSSLSRLKNLPLNFLEIARSLTARLGERPEDRAIVAATIYLSHALGWSAIAQGVENEEQLSLLRELGCDLAQGYYFSKPVTAQEATALLEGDLARSL